MWADNVRAWRTWSQNSRERGWCAVSLREAQPSTAPWVLGSRTMKPIMRQTYCEAFFSPSHYSLTLHHTVYRQSVCVVPFILASSKSPYRASRSGGDG